MSELKAVSGSSCGLPKEDRDFLVEAGEHVAACLVNDVSAEILTDDTVPWLSYTNSNSGYDLFLAPQRLLTPLLVELLLDGSSDLALLLVVIESLHYRLKIVKIWVRNSGQWCGREGLTCLAESCMAGSMSQTRMWSFTIINLKFIIKLIYFGCTSQLT